MAPVGVRVAGSVAAQFVVPGDLLRTQDRHLGEMRAQMHFAQLARRHADFVRGPGEGFDPDVTARERSVQSTLLLDEPAADVARLRLHRLEQRLRSRPLLRRQHCLPALDGANPPDSEIALQPLDLAHLRLDLRKIDGLGARFNGTYFITDTTHTLNDSGYVTKFNARREVTGSLEGLE